jgi:hypothetical protein
MTPESEPENDALCAPSLPLPLGGRVLAICPPTLADMASIAAVVRCKVRRETPLASLVNDPAFSRLPPACQVEAAREAAKAQVSGGGPVDVFALTDELLSPDTLAFAVWTLARKAHPDLTLEQVRRGVTEANAPEVFARYNQACGMADLGNGAGPSGSRGRGTAGPSSAA